MSDDSEFGETLRNGIITKDDGIHCFKLTKERRCTFLNDNNLCEIILNLGEEYLCDICREHPRFYEASQDGYIKRYGLCCEEAGRIILSSTDAVDKSISDMHDEYAECPDFNDSKNVSDFAHMLLSLEQLEDGWGKCVTALNKANMDGLDIDYYMDRIKSYEQPFIHLLEYLMSRYHDELYASIVWQFLRLLFAYCICKKSIVNYESGISELIELCRLYSSEIEYSDVNVEMITQWLEEYYVN